MAVGPRRYEDDELAVVPYNFFDREDHEDNPSNMQMVPRHPGTVANNPMGNLATMAMATLPGPSVAKMPLWLAKKAYDNRVELGHIGSKIGGGAVELFKRGKRGLDWALDYHSPKRQKIDESQGKSQEPIADVSGTGSDTVLSLISNAQ